MRNVDRDVLREAVDLADIQDMFTPDFEKEMHVRFDKLMERQAFLETIAFGTILLKIVRTIMLFLRFLPQARAIIIILAIFTLVDRYASTKEVPTAKDIGEFAESTGLTKLLTDIKQEIRDAIQPLVDQAKEAKKLTDTMMGELHFALLQTGVAMQQSIDLISQGLYGSASQTLIVAEDKLGDFDNLYQNYQTLVSAQMRDAIAKLESVIEVTPEEEAEKEASKARDIAMLSDPIRFRRDQRDPETIETPSA